MRGAITLTLLVLLAACSSTTQTTVNTMNPHVILETSKGTIEIELNREAAPTTVANFLSYTEDGFYDGLVFHRVINKFMIQGGGFTTDGARKDTRPAIPLEAALPNTRGTIAMARTNDPNSATSQFFINHADNAFLNPGPGTQGYTVFGNVVEGMDVVDTIASVQTQNKHGMDDWPVEEVQILRAYIK